MAETLIFHYQKGDSGLHRQDVPVKMAALLCFSLLLLPVSLFRLSLLLPLLLLAHRASSLQLKGLFKESLFFFVMGGIILISNSLGSGSLPEGLLKMARFFAILWMALLFTYTTDPLTVSAGIYRMIKPLPLLPARQISTTLGLSLTMLPLILDQIREIREAMWSRCGMNRRTPVRNMVRLGLPLMEGILAEAENLADAMESRLYTEEATPPEAGATQSGLPLLILLAVLFALILGTESLPAVRTGNYFYFCHY